jgi:hypothetical protein
MPSLTFGKPHAISRIAGIDIVKKGHLSGPQDIFTHNWGKTHFPKAKTIAFKRPDFQRDVFGTTFSSLNTKPLCMKQKGVTKQKGTKSLKDRVHQHLNDKNDVITEQDMKNIKVGDESPEEPKAIEDADKLADAIKERKQTSPWSLLSEEDK